MWLERELVQEREPVQERELECYRRDHMSLDTLDANSLEIPGNPRRSLGWPEPQRLRNHRRPR